RWKDIHYPQQHRPSLARTSATNFNTTLSCADWPKYSEESGVGYEARPSVVNSTIGGMEKLDEESWGDHNEKTYVESHTTEQQNQENAEMEKKQHNTEMSSLVPKSTDGDINGIQPNHVTVEDAL
ncbi:unnamed protein product, partial [Meganyctiphanes norvegica]